MFNPPSCEDLPPPELFHVPLNTGVIHISDDGVVAGSCGYDNDNIDQSLIIPASDNMVVHPAMIGLNRPHGDILVGIDSLNSRESDPKIWGLCRLLGKTYREALGGADSRHLMLRPSPDDELLVGLGGYFKTVDEWLGMLVQRCWDDLTTFLGSSPPRVIITYSDRLTLASRQRLVQLVESIGVRVNRIVRHSVSALAALGWDDRMSAGGSSWGELLRVLNPGEPVSSTATVMLAYMGYEQTEVVIGELDSDIVEICHVRVDRHCGVRDLDDVVVSRLTALIEAHLGTSLHLDHLQYGHLLRVAAQIRFVLSHRQKTIVQCPEYGDFSYEVCVDEWRAWVQPVTQRLASLLDGFEDPLTMTGHTVQAAVCLGALSVIPTLHTVCEKALGAPYRIGRAIQPDDDRGVVAGAVGVAAIIQGRMRTSLLMDVSAFSLAMCVGLEEDDEPFENVFSVIQRDDVLIAGADPYFRPVGDRTQRAVLELVEYRTPGQYHTVGMLEFAALQNDPHDEYIIQCSVRMDHRLGLTVTARDVHTGAVRSIQLPHPNRYVVDSRSRPRPCSSDVVDQLKLRPSAFDARDFYEFLYPEQRTQYRISQKPAEPILTESELAALLHHLEEESGGSIEDRDSEGQREE